MLLSLTKYLSEKFLIICISFIFSTNIAHAESPTIGSENIGDWRVTFYQDGTSIASTPNSTGSLFGIYCSKKSCNAFFEPKQQCVDGDEYPGLVNSPSSAYSVIMRCTKTTRYFFLEFPFDSALADAMSVGGMIGFAFPMESGDFKVARFSLTGSARASARAQQFASGSTRDQKSQTGDNYTL